MDSEEMRRRVRDSRCFSEGVDAFFRLLGQPNLKWSDLICGLGYRGLISEAATIRLHRALGVPVPRSGFIMDCAFWEDIFRKRGIADNAVVMDLGQPTSQAPRQLL